MSFRQDRLGDPLRNMILRRARNFYIGVHIIDVTKNDSKRRCPGTRRQYLTVQGFLVAMGDKRTHRVTPDRGVASVNRICSDLRRDSDEH